MAKTPVHLLLGVRIRVHLGRVEKTPALRLLGERIPVRPPLVVKIPVRLLLGERIRVHLWRVERTPALRLFGERIPVLLLDVSVESGLSLRAWISTDSQRVDSRLILLITNI